MSQQHGNTRHGAATRAGRTPAYHTWQHVISRCTNPNSDRWRWYGAKGVRVCERWKVFENFLSDMGERPLGTTLGRFGDVGDYEPKNCAWMTKQQQTTTSRLHDKANIDSGTGVKGVSWDAARQLFRAQIRIAGKQTFLGRFASVEEAKAAHQKEVARLCLK